MRKNKHNFKKSEWLIGCTAVLALVPSIQVAIAVAGAIPSGITVVLNKTHVEEKKAALKAQHRNKKTTSFTHTHNVNATGY